MTTIAPVFPGTIGDYTDQAPDSGAFTRRQERQQRQDKRAGRVRKPNRRPGAILEKAARAVSVTAVAFTVGAVLASLAITGHVL